MEKLSNNIGFASYDNQQSAQNAAMVMNGFSAMGKHLKVELKKDDDAYPPYAAGGPMRNMMSQP